MYSFHPFHGAVTPLANDARKHMLAVIEIHEIRQIMYLDPMNRPLFLHRLLQLFDLDRLLFE